MRKSKNMLRCFAPVMLVALIGIALLPAGVFAADPPDHAFPLSYTPLKPPTATENGVKAHYQCTGCQKYFTDETATTEVLYENLIIPAVGPIGKKFELDDYTLQFKTDVVMKPPQFMANSNIDHVWIRASQSSMKVKWDNAENMDFVDGVVILRKTGKSSVYKEVGRLSFDNGLYKTSYTDKTANKKNTPYSYIAVTYHDQDGVTYISHCSDWAAGQTTASKLKTVYKAKINKSLADMQYNDTLQLSLKYSSPRTTYNSSSFRWYSDNPAIAKVSKKGKVRAKAPGTILVRGRLSSGYDVTCKVRIVGAFTPDTPTLKVDVASNNSITLIWNSVKNATSYDLYRSDDGLHWNDPVRVNGTTKKVTGLVKDHTYYFYLIARNDNGPYTALSGNSNVVHQKAKIVRRPTKVTGWPKAKTLIGNRSYTMKISISSPTGRKGSLQMMSGGKWITKKTISLPKGAGVSSMFIYFPNDWWNYDTSKWRLYIPYNDTSQEYTSPTLTITATRAYQNPSRYVQISNTISSHGYSYYISPVLINSASSKSDCIEALIRTANKYKGCRYRQSASGAPSGGVDESGLIIQSCYGAGVDLWPISPSTRPYNCVTEILNKSRLRSISFKNAAEGSNNYPNITRGDLLFFCNKNGYCDHAAIYLGYGQIIHASPIDGVVETDTIRELLDPYGRYGYNPDAVYVRRIFN